jgi:[ribosomal protein S18]-alanine N-acetyltransferase
MITVIEGSGNDVAAIMPVMDSAFDPAFGEAWTAAQCLSTLSMPGSLLFCAHSQQTMLGFALSRWVTDEEELLLIAVSQNVRRKGVGRLLIEKLISNARHSGRALIFLEVRDGNPAMGFYHEMGFHPLGRRPNYYKGKDGSRHDSITMSLKL